MFHSARIKLTAWYLAIIMLISISFSVVIYRVLTSEVDRLATIQRTRIERRLREGGVLPAPTIQNAPPPFLLSDPDLLEETKRRVLLILLVVDCGITVFAGGLGYFLAGRTLEPIQDMLDEQNRFISDASHELRTPLTSLKSAFEVYLRDKHPKPTDAHTLVKESVDEVNKLQVLSESLLELAQYQKPVGGMLMEKLMLNQIVDKAVHRVEPMAQQKKITIKKDIRNIILNGNIHGLSDLLVILLDNAIKYSNDKTNIYIKAVKTDGHVELSVKDQGIGIASTDLPHIFDRFYRADSARRKTTTGGYGLGLSIAKKIVNTHNGTIHVESSIGKGSTFIVRLPISFS